MVLERLVIETGCAPNLSPSQRGGLEPDGQEQHCGFRFKLLITLLWNHSQQ